MSRIPVSAMSRHTHERALGPSTTHSLATSPGRAPLDPSRIRNTFAAVLLASLVLASGAQSAAAAQGGIAECSIATTAASDGYGYPYRDPYLATITAAALNPDGLTPGLKRQVIHVSVLPERNRIPHLEGRGDVSVALYRQHRPAPLIFILSGIGSNPYFGLGTYFASEFHHAGFHVVVLPSPMNWNFALAASPSGAPGYAPDDARDLYRVMQKTLEAIKSRHGVRITSVDFMGASLGALEGAYLSVIDADQRAIDIRRYLFVNPPLDLVYALGRLDEWTALQDRFGKERSDALRARALTIAESYMTDRRNEPAAVDRLARRFACFTNEELQFLIAEYVQTTVPELVYVTQAIHDRQLLVTAKNRVSERLEEAKAFTLADYTNKVAIPTWSRRVGLASDTERIESAGSLMAILDRVRGNPRVFVMHNADDVLTERGSVEALKAVMGNQMMLYPRGGHLGNLWFQDNREAILELFSASSPVPSTR